MSIGSLIDDAGGTTVVAAGLGVAAPVVSNWRARGRLPPEWWGPFVTFARQRGVNSITFEAIARLHPPSERAEACG